MFIQLDPNDRVIAQSNINNELVYVIQEPESAEYVILSENPAGNGYTLLWRGNFNSTMSMLSEILADKEKEFYAKHSPQDFDREDMIENLRLKLSGQL
jgi:hypothetical protein